MNSQKDTNNFRAYSSIDFDHVKQKANSLAKVIRNKTHEVTDILIRYESHEVATDEIERTLDLLENLIENEQYFKYRARAITSFLPRNQPLYALTCFVIVPSLMASEVHFRIPNTMHGFFSDILSTLEILTIFPNINISKKERLYFLKERSALLVNPTTKEARPVTDAVIFTGTSLHADQLRLVFDRKTLFITNGSGHNPLVVAEGANIENAVEAVLSVSLYNQGQDCAAPNSILLHGKIYEKFMAEFYRKFEEIKIGPYSDKTCRIGPISNSADLPNIAGIIVTNKEWLDPKTKGIIRIRESIVEPTVILKPLKDGGNYFESFSPIIFIQQYEKDCELEKYFSNRDYAHNAMYLTLYGESEYLKSIIGKPVSGKILHYKDTFLHNIHLHQKGVERGTRPYGGYGRGASNLSMDGRVVALPTLPQRDIFEWLIQPIIRGGKISNLVSTDKDFTEIEYKNVEKILRMKIVADNTPVHAKVSEFMYFDSDSIKSDVRYIKIDDTSTHRLLDEINTEHITRLSLDDLRHIRALKLLVEGKASLSLEDFSGKLYLIPKEHGLTDAENKIRQSAFFKNIYQLLFKKDRGPKLAQFLWEIEEGIVPSLLDV